MKIQLLLIILFLSFSAIGQTEVEKTISTINKSDIESQIYFLASDELKGRQTASDELKIAGLFGQYFEKIQCKARR